MTAPDDAARHDTACYCLLRHLRENAIAAVFKAEIVVIAAGSIAPAFIEANPPQLGTLETTGRCAVRGLVERQAGACNKKKKSDLFKHAIPL